MKTGILAVFGGASRREDRARSLDPVLRRIEAACPGVPVYGARDAWGAEDPGAALDGVDEALARMARDGVTALRVLPVVLWPGDAYRRIWIQTLGAGFASWALAAPLLGTPEDCRAVVQAVAGAIPTAPGEALVLVGRGVRGGGGLAAVEAAANALGLGHVFAGTPQNGPEAVLSALRAGGWTRAVLTPLRLSTGRDLDGWRDRFVQDGVPVRTVCRSLGEYEAVQALLAAHLRAIL